MCETCIHYNSRDGVHGFCRLWCERVQADETCHYIEYGGPQA